MTQQDLSLLAPLLLLLHSAATLAMAGLIWFVQIVHYPLFASVSRSHFADYERLNLQRTTRVVAPLMLIEALTATLIVLGDLTPSDRITAWIGLALVLLIWLSTVLVQVPLHRRLAEGYDAGAIAYLVRSNWVRTVAWTLRGIVALRLLPA